MFKVEAIVRPKALQDVKEGLEALGCDDFVVSDVQGNSDQPGHAACYRGVNYDLPLVHQLRIEVCVTETMLEAVIDRIANAAHTGQPGDGMIFISALADVIDIGGEHRGPPRRRAPLLDRAWRRSPAIGRAPGKAPVTNPFDLGCRLSQEFRPFGARRKPAAESRIWSPFPERVL